MINGMTLVEPLRFRPLFKAVRLGRPPPGHRCSAKPIGDGDRYAESWEIVDHGADQSVVADGTAGRHDAARTRDRSTARRSSAATIRSRSFRCC